MSIIRSPLEPPSFTHGYYSKTSFFEALATLVAALLAQVVLTLRSVFFDSDRLVLITA
jgi:hypothetical protein